MLVVAALSEGIVVDIAVVGSVAAGEQEDQIVGQGEAAMDAHLKTSWNDGLIWIWRSGF